MKPASHFAALVAILLPAESLASSLDTCATPTSTAVFIAGVIGCCMSRSTDQRDLAVAQERGFYKLEDMEKWPGHSARAAAAEASRRLPSELQARACDVIRRHSLSNAELHARYLFLFGPESARPLQLQTWKRAIGRFGPLSWELQGVFEDVLSYAARFPDSAATMRSPHFDLLKEVQIAASQIGKSLAPYLAHVRLIDAVWDPFLAPRSGFGLAPRGSRVTIAFGPGLNSADHRMTLWHEVIHYPVRRVIEDLEEPHAVLRLMSRLSRTLAEMPVRKKQLDFGVLEENIVAVLTDFLCPTPMSRPDMDFDEVIRNHLQRSSGDINYIDLRGMVLAIIKHATRRP